MFGIFVGLILSGALFYVLGLKVEKTEGTYGGYNIKTVWSRNKKQFLALIPVIVFSILSCVSQIPTGYTGILTTFGRVEDVTLDAGFNFKTPWQRVVKMDNRIQKSQIELSCFSADIQEVKVVYTINYSINKESAQNLYRNVGTDYYDTVIVPRVQECVKASFAKYTAESLIADRNVVAAAIESDLSDNLAKYNIDLGDTAIEDVDFSDEFTNAAEAKVTAQQDKLTAQTKQEQLNLEAKAAADRQIIQANADAEAAIIAATNDAEVAKIAADASEYQGIKDSAIMSNLGSMLTKYPNLIDYYKAIGWDGKLPNTMIGTDSNTLFNVR